MCEYKFRRKIYGETGYWLDSEFGIGEPCKEETLPNSDYCILHIDLPEDVESDEFKKINELKEEKVKEKVDKGDFNFGYCPINRDFYIHLV